MGRVLRKALRVLAVSVVGTVLLVGALVSAGPLPGPSLLLFLAALAVFALEFRWAHRLRERAGEELADRIPERYHPWLRRLGLGTPATPERDADRGGDPAPDAARSPATGCGGDGT